MTTIFPTRSTRLCGGIALLLTVSLGGMATAQTDEETLLRNAAGRSVAVAAVLDLPLESPADRLAAVFTLLDLNEIDVAATLLAPVLKAEHDDQARAEFVQQFGTARFLSLARRDKPSASGEASPLAGAREFARACLQAASQRSRDPKHIADLVGKLNDESAEVRNAARVDLAVTGPGGAQACLEALAQETDDARRANLMLAITKMRPEVDPLLLAVLSDAEGHLLRDAAEIAGHTGMLNAAPFLAAIAVRPENAPETRAAAQTALVKLGLSQADLSDARGLLLGEIRRLEAQEPLRSLLESDQQTWWLWQHRTGPKALRNEPGKFASQRFSAETMRTATLERLARTLVSCGHADLQDRLLAAIYFLELPEGIFGAVVLILDEYSREQLSQMLLEAVERNCMVAAIRCVDELGQRGEAEALSSFDGRPTPLARALKHPDRRLRFAALEAVMKISPQRTFAGASSVQLALWEFAAGAGMPQAVAASSVVTRASDWAGQLRSLGYDAIPAATGREAIQTALDSKRLALVLVDSDIGRPRLREVIYQLRAGRTTARIPIGVLSSLPNLDTAHRLAEQDPLLVAVARPHSDEALASVVEALVALKPAMASPETKLKQAAQALAWIAQLQQAGHPYDELHRDAGTAEQALFVTELTAPALEALAVLGTADSQQALVDFVSHPAMTLEARAQAVLAFAASVKRFGKLLTPTEISIQFDRYNASETADRGTQQVLGQLLDILEDKPLSPIDP